MSSRSRPRRFSKRSRRPRNAKAVILRRTDSVRSRFSFYDPKAEYEVNLKDFMAWLDRNSRSPRETINRMKIRELLGVKKMREIALTIDLNWKARSCPTSWRLTSTSWPTVSRRLKSSTARRSPRRRASAVLILSARATVPTWPFRTPMATRGSSRKSRRRRQDASCRRADHNDSGRRSSTSAAWGTCKQIWCTLGAL